MKDTSSFITNLEALDKAGITLTDRAKIQELNKARVSFKHYGNLPAPDEARKFQVYTEDFLRAAVADHFGQNFDSISLVDLISFSDVRSHLKSAEASIEACDFEKAIHEIAIAKVLLFSRLERHIPVVDHNLGVYDGLFELATGKRGMRAFATVNKTLARLREVCLVTLLRIPLNEYAFLRDNLPTAMRFGDGHWEIQDMRLVPRDESQCRRCIAILVDLSIRLGREVLEGYS